MSWIKYGPIQERNKRGHHRDSDNSQYTDKVSIPRTTKWLKKKEKKYHLTPERTMHFEVKYEMDMTFTFIFFFFSFH